jgi:predicted SAM-dependent methyltransferase
LTLNQTLSDLAQHVPFYRSLRRRAVVEGLRRQIAVTKPLNLMIGGGQTAYDGWIFTDRDFLDVTQPDQWAALFTADTIDRILSEHMLEHLSESQAETTLRECHRYLKPGGLLRLAVPDGYRRDAAYVAEAAPPNDGHQVFYNIDTLTSLLSSLGFTVTPLEYFDANERFHARPWDENEGMIMRSVRFDTQKDFQRGDLFYTSLIVDARK